ncbi:MAG: DUF2339 domain-containing protein [Planctomycetes bacterium]|nr:DUF2339 domain-containing protein [Planctomycetota bacterium]
MAWVGAIVLVIGAGFLVKLGYDAGWWAKLSPLTRCLLVAGFGAALVGAGEVALRRIGPAASTGLFGAGLGTLYLVAYAAFQWFDPPLISQEGSFILLAVVALVGFGITLHSRFLTIGILSIVGGYLTPWLFKTTASHTLEVGFYLTMLFGIALALSAVRPRSFRGLRYWALAALGVTGLGWVVSAMNSGEWFASLFFVSVWWTFVLIETVLAALRRQSPTGNVVGSLLATAWFVTVGCWVLAPPLPSPSNWLGLFCLAVSVLAAAVAAQFGPSPADLGRPRTAMDKLAVALWAQCGVLLAVAVALQFDGYGRSIGWLAIAVASIEIGRRLGSRAVDLFGIAAGALAVASIAFVDWWHSQALMKPIWESGFVSVNGYSILLLAAVVATHAAARRLQSVWRILPAFVAGVGTMGWMGLCWICVAQAGGPATTGGWLAGCAGLLAAERIGRRQRYLTLGLLLLAATAAKWLLVDAALGPFGGSWDPDRSLPLANSQMAYALAIAGFGWWASRLLARRTHLKPPGAEAEVSTGWQVALVASMVFLLVGLSFEVSHIIDRRTAAQGGDGLVAAAWSPNQLEALWWTALWAAGGLAMMLWTRLQSSRAMLTTGCLIVMLAAVGWLGYDTLVWRFDGVVPVPVVFNLQFGVGASLVVMLAGGMWILGRAAQTPTEAIEFGRTMVAGFVLIGLIGLWLGSLEIDRFFAPESGHLARNAAMARQTGLSIYWALFAIGLIGLGFAGRWALCRYAGLALMAITLGKVLTVDMAGVQTVYRVLSLLGVGLLLVGTSVGYAKLAPRAQDT